MDDDDDDDDNDDDDNDDDDGNWLNWGGKKRNKKLAILRVRIERLMYIVSLGTCDCDSTASAQILWGNGVSAQITTVIALRIDRLYFLSQLRAFGFCTLPVHSYLSLTCS